MQEPVLFVRASPCPEQGKLQPGLSLGTAAATGMDQSLQIPDATPDVSQWGFISAYQFYQTISISLSFALIFKINFILPFSCKRDTNLASNKAATSKGLWAIYSIPRILLFNPILPTLNPFIMSLAKSFHFEFALKLNLFPSSSSEMDLSNDSYQKDRGHTK